MIESNKFRYERKFVVPYLIKDEVEAVIKNNPAFFREIYSERKINNIYLDTVDYKNYFDNVLGNADRTKVRIRWYGEPKEIIEKPVLELKIKRGLVGTKLSFPIESFKKYELGRKVFHIIFRKAYLPDWLFDKLKNHRIALFNSYIRKYYLSSCRRFRVTIDSDLTYSGILAQDNLVLTEPK
jgi:hypothetical protein